MARVLKRQAARTSLETNVEQQSHPCRRNGNPRLQATPIGLRYSGILGQDVSLLQWLDYSMDPGSSRRPVSKLTHYLSLWKELFQSRQERRASWPPNTHS